jgi:hypothetical protein
MLVENRRLTPCPRPVWDGMWVFAGTFRPAGTVHRGDGLFLPTYCPDGTSGEPLYLVYFASLSTISQEKKYKNKNLIIEKSCIFVSL